MNMNNVEIVAKAEKTSRKRPAVGSFEDQLMAADRNIVPTKRSRKSKEEKMGKNVQYIKVAALNATTPCVPVQPLEDVADRENSYNPLITIQ
ncbi:unnamed protein product [Bursaphelenchus okinawaensis]|uniref:Uncharacterized protein n=1 Tax=Bursaphelenchus okinawaensis TaxID=465554 RepID=A0A811LKX9_9BILA|nr:unnamed protein product [Bursaphelenchus okinawaensis]CAG9127664.1 unnamed protein product [Bursaphelenchus okinawaensis]